MESGAGVTLMRFRYPQVSVLEIPRGRHLLFDWVCLLGLASFACSMTMRSKVHLAPGLSGCEGPSRPVPWGPLWLQNLTCPFWARG